MKSIDFFVLSVALAGIMCLSSKTYDNYQRNQVNSSVVVIPEMDQSYIVKQLERDKKKKAVLAAIQRQKRIKDCKLNFSCKVMAEAIYFEARGESEKGQIAVGQVILERAKRAKPEKSIHYIVNKRGSNGHCHFTYVCEIEKGIISAQIKEKIAFERALDYAYGILSKAYPQYVKGADHYYNPNKVVKKPYWADSMRVVGYIGNHLFLDSRR